MEQQQRRRDSIVGTRLPKDFDPVHEFLKLLMAGVPPILQAFTPIGPNDKEHEKEQNHVSIGAFLRMVVERLSSKVGGKKEYLRSDKRLGHYISGSTSRCVHKYVTERQYVFLFFFFFLPFLTFFFFLITPNSWYNIVRFDRLNESTFIHSLFRFYSLAFFRLVTYLDKDGVAHFSFDESMCGWLKKLCDSIRNCPRKKEAMGLLIYTIATFLSATNQAVILFMLPNLKDAHSANYGYKEIFLLQMAILKAARAAKQIPKYISVVSDRLFCYPDVIAGHFNTVDIWASIGLKKGTDFATVLRHKFV